MKTNWFVIVPLLLLVNVYLVYTVLLAALNYDVNLPHSFWRAEIDTHLWKPVTFLPQDTRYCVPEGERSAQRFVLRRADQHQQRQPASSPTSLTSEVGRSGTPAALPVLLVPSQQADVEWMTSLAEQLLAWPSDQAKPAVYLADWGSSFMVAAHTARVTSQAEFINAGLRAIAHAQEDAHVQPMAPLVITAGFSAVLVRLAATLPSARLAPRIETLVAVDAPLQQPMWPGNVKLNMLLDELRIRYMQAYQARLAELDCAWIPADAAQPASTTGPEAAMCMQRESFTQLVARDVAAATNSPAAASDDPDDMIQDMVLLSLYRASSGSLGPADDARAFYSETPPARGAELPLERLPMAAPRSGVHETDSALIAGLLRTVRALGMVEQAASVGLQPGVLQRTLPDLELPVCTAARAGQADWRARVMPTARLHAALRALSGAQLARPQAAETPGLLPTCSAAGDGAASTLSSPAIKPAAHAGALMADMAVLARARLYTQADGWVSWFQETNRRVIVRTTAASAAMPSSVCFRLLGDAYHIGALHVRLLSSIPPWELSVSGQADADSEPTMLPADSVHLLQGELPHNISKDAMRMAPWLGSLAATSGAARSSSSSSSSSSSQASALWFVQYSWARKEQAQATPSVCVRAALASVRSARPHVLHFALATSASAFDDTAVEMSAEAMHWMLPSTLSDGAFKLQLPPGLPLYAPLDVAVEAGRDCEAMASAVGARYGSNGMAMHGAELAGLGLPSAMWIPSSCVPASYADDWPLSLALRCPQAQYLYARGDPVMLPSNDALIHRFRLRLAVAPEPEDASDSGWLLMLNTGPCNAEVRLGVAWSIFGAAWLWARVRRAIACLAIVLLAMHGLQLWLWYKRQRAWRMEHALWRARLWERSTGLVLWGTPAARPAHAPFVAHPPAVPAPPLFPAIFHASAALRTLIFTVLLSSTLQVFASRWSAAPPEHPSAHSQLVRPWHMAPGLRGTMWMDVARQSPVQQWGELLIMHVACVAVLWALSFLVDTGVSSLRSAVRWCACSRCPGGGAKSLRRNNSDEGVDVHVGLAPATQRRLASGGAAPRMRPREMGSTSESPIELDAEARLLPVHSPQQALAPPSAVPSSSSGSQWQLGSPTSGIQPSFDALGAEALLGIGVPLPRASSSGLRLQLPPLVTGTTPDSHLHMVSEAAAHARARRAGRVSRKLRKGFAGLSRSSRGWAFTPTIVEADAEDLASSDSDIDGLGSGRHHLGDAVAAAHHLSNLPASPAHSPEPATPSASMPAASILRSDTMDALRAGSDWWDYGSQASSSGTGWGSPDFSTVSPEDVFSLMPDAEALRQVAHIMARAEARADRALLHRLMQSTSYSQQHGSGSVRMRELMSALAQACLRSAAGQARATYARMKLVCQSSGRRMQWQPSASHAARRRAVRPRGNSLWAGLAEARQAAATGARAVAAAACCWRPSSHMPDVHQLLVTAALVTICGFMLYMPWVVLAASWLALIAHTGVMSAVLGSPPSHVRQDSHAAPAQASPDCLPGAADPEPSPLLRAQSVTPPLASPAELRLMHLPPAVMPGTSSATPDSDDFSNVRLRRVRSDTGTEFVQALAVPGTSSGAGDASTVQTIAAVQREVRAWMDDRNSLRKQRALAALYGVVVLVQWPAVADALLAWRLYTSPQWGHAALALPMVAHLTLARMIGPVSHAWHFPAMLGMATLLAAGAHGLRWFVPLFDLWACIELGTVLHRWSLHSKPAQIARAVSRTWLRRVGQHLRRARSQQPAATQHGELPTHTRKVSNQAE